MKQKPKIWFLFVKNFTNNYVPTTSTEYIVDVTDSGETKQFNVTSDVFHYTLFGKSCVYMCMIYNNVLIAFKEEIS